MSNQVLDFSSLKKAIISLERAILRAEKEKQDEELRDAVIQRFEYTYELCWKMLKRQLELVMPSAPAVDQLSYRQLMREGAERGLIENPEYWFVYREQHNMTSHTYDQEKANTVYQTALHFLKSAKNLLLHLEQQAL